MKAKMFFFIKRSIDVVLAVILIIFFSPIAIITAIAIRLETPGPIFADTPPRVGRDGKPFRLYKFRSMIANAHNLLRTDPKLAKLFEEYKKNSYKLVNDPRVTGVGKFIRKHSIDELPQLVNVLKGEMSIVGPRPYYPDELEEQQKKYPNTKKYVKEVMDVKPGITGLWQTSGRSEINFDKRIKMDAQYARKKSLMLDLMIMIKSPIVMITGKGAA